MVDSKATVKMTGSDKEYALMVKYEKRIATVSQQIDSQILKLELTGPTDANIAELKRLQNKRHTLKQSLKDGKQKLNLNNSTDSPQTNSSKDKVSQTDETDILKKDPLLIADRSKLNLLRRKHEGFVEKYIP